MTRQLVLAFLLLSCVPLKVFAQTPPQTKPPQSSPTPDEKDDVVRITTNLVQVDASVTKDGKPVKDLKAEDFEIFEDGRKQIITSFAYISNLPAATLSSPPSKSTKVSDLPPPAPLRPNENRRTIALVVDDLGLSAESMGAVRKQLRKFVTEQLQPNDLVAIIRTGGTIGALQQFTNDRRLLDRALTQVKWNICSRVGVTVLAPIVPGRFSQSSMMEGGPCGIYSVTNTMKALRFIVESMGELPGRKSMIVFSDSLPREDQDLHFEQIGSNSPSPFRDTRSYSFLLKRIAEMAIRSSVVIYSVDTQGLQTTGITAADMIDGSVRDMNTQISNIMSSRSALIMQRREGAELIARQTGGFLVRNSNDFQLSRILEDQSGYYLLGYRPSDETFNKTFHHIKARVKRSGMTLRTRFGFFGISEEEAAKTVERTAEDKTNIALMSPFGSQDINIELSTLFANDKTMGSLLRTFLYIDAHDLIFKDDDTGAHIATIELSGVLFGNNGSVTDRRRDTITARLKGKPYDDAMRDGFMIRFDMPVKRPGYYQLRIAARDVNSSRIGAAGEFVSVPDLSNKRLALSGIVLRAGSKASQPGDVAQQEVSLSPAIKRYKAGTRVEFGCVIYNSQLDPQTNKPVLVMEARLFHDDKLLYTSPAMPVDAGQQPDLTRVLSSGLLQLDSTLEPGTYYLKLLVNDSLAKDKEAKATQWVDFEVVK